MVLVTRFGAQPKVPQLTPQLALVESSRIEDGRQTTMRPRSTRSKKAETHNARGLDLAGAGNIEGAIAEFRRAVAADPRNFKAHNNLGVLYQRKGWIPQAKSEYEAASKAEPGSPVPYRNMAILNEDRSQLKEALRNYSRYLDLAPHAPDRETILLKIRDLGRKVDSKSRG
ncbi:MAG TPA: tetratricopeptide repeat protein [archaeon]|nr:tetratricopeptide repeat protein [archaeon]